MNNDDPDIKSAEKVIFTVALSLTFMVLIALGVLLFTSCQSLPQICQTVDDIATDDAIIVKVDRDAIQEKTDVTVTVEVKNKE